MEISIGKDNIYDGRFNKACTDNGQYVVVSL